MLKRDKKRGWLIYFLAIPFYWRLNKKIYFEGERNVAFKPRAESSTLELCLRRSNENELNDKIDFLFSLPYSWNLIGIVYFTLTGLPLS